MQIIIKEKNKTRINHLLDWIIYMIGYTIVFIFVTSFFKSFHIDSDHLIIWAFFIVLVLYTGITLGLFYPCINVFILKLVDWILGKHFEIDSLLVALLVAILLSITNFIMEEAIKQIIEKVKKHD